MNALGRFGLAALWVIAVGVARADYEADLLARYQKKNDAAGEKLRQEAESSLAQAAGLRASEPDKAVALLHKSLNALEKDTLLPRTTREPLTRRLREELAAAQARVDERQKESDRSKRDWARGALAERLDRSRKDAPGGVVHGGDAGASDPTFERSPIFFSPVVAPVPSAASFTVTPTVSGNRRFIRIGVGGSFVIPRISAVPVPVVTPTVLQGPGRNLTVVPPVVVNYVPAYVPTFTTGGINTTVVAPAGGGAFVGGFSSGILSRAEFGTPILGGVPYAGRLFRNAAFAGTTSGFALGVLPRVIVLE